MLSVEAPFGPRYYWRSTVFETYNANSWEWSHVRTVRAFTDSSGLEFNQEPTLPGARQDVTQSFEILLRASDLVYAAPQPLRMGLPVEAELDCVLDRSSQACVNGDDPTDVAIIRARSPLRQGASYTVTSSISAASADMLRAASPDYPSWVRDLYLQGAEDVSPRVRDLAAQIVASAGAQTPYDRAKAIERWLRANIQYNETIPAPPEGLTDRLVPVRRARGLLQLLRLGDGDDAALAGHPGAAGGGVCAGRVRKRRVPGPRARRAHLGRSLFPRLQLDRVRANCRRSAAGPAGRPGAADSPAHAHADADAYTQPDPDARSADSGCRRECDAHQPGRQSAGSADANPDTHADAQPHPDPAAEHGAGRREPGGAFCGRS